MRIRPFITFPPAVRRASDGVAERLSFPRSRGGPPTLQRTRRPHGTGVLALALGIMMLAGAGCRRGADAAEGSTQATVAFTPNPPAVGVTNVSITLVDDAGEPLRLGFLDVEANMNHAGMKPVFTRLDEAAPGSYTGTVEFTMGGDWFLLLSGQSADGARFERTIDVPGVRSK